MCCTANRRPGWRIRPSVLGSTWSGKEQYLALALVESMTRKLWAGPDPPGQGGIRERIYNDDLLTWEVPQAATKLHKYCDGEESATLQDSAHQVVW